MSFEKLGTDCAWLPPVVIDQEAFICPAITKIHAEKSLEKSALPITVCTRPKQKWLPMDSTLLEAVTVMVQSVAVLPEARLRTRI